MDRPFLAVVVIFHNMRREAARTLYSLSATYQSNVCENDYEVIAIDNGSSLPLSAADVRQFGANFNYHFFATQSVSPVCAINYGAQIASAEYISVIVDGARMVTPGLIDKARRALSDDSHPFVCSLAWHLGPDVQNKTMLDGYSQLEEDRLLKSIDWQNNGYRLFEISVLAQSSYDALRGAMPYECSWFAMPRAVFMQMGGYDERFHSPGGGLVNQDFLNRLAKHPAISPIILLDEGSFHQFHGGVATNVPLNEHPFNDFNKEYQQIHNEPYSPLSFNQPINYRGGVHPLAAKHFFVEGSIFRP